MHHMRLTVDQIKFLQLSISSGYNLDICNFIELKQNCRQVSIGNIQNLFCGLSHLYRNDHLTFLFYPRQS